MSKKIYNIDAAGKVLGRVATEAANYLTGKNTTSFAKNIFPDVEVKIVNAGKLSVSEKKSTVKTYNSYSGYPSGLKQESLSHLAARKGMSEILRKAINGMIPINRLRNEIMKNLTITE
jgi:large subunit ribosomal protein L13